MSQSLRLNVCSHTGICVPVRFALKTEGNRTDIMTEDVQEFVDAVYRADDSLSELESDDEQ